MVNCGLYINQILLRFWLLIQFMLSHTIMAKSIITQSGVYGGYQECFLDAVPERLKCSICTKVLRDPHLMVCCGQKYCISCLQKWFKDQTKEICPHCRATRKHSHEALHVLDKGVKSEVESLTILCSNCEKGCEWVGELRDISHHIENCGYVEKCCPNNCRTGQGTQTRTFRKDMKEHLNYYCELRVVECQYCGHAETARNIFSHQEFCKAIKKRR